MTWISENRPAGKDREGKLIICHYHQMINDLMEWNWSDETPKWWAPKMDNYMGSFSLLIRLNPPFSLVYCMFFIIFMLIEWFGLVIMQTSLMGALCSFIGQFWDKIKGFNEHLAAKFVEEQGRGFVGRCPLHLWAITSNCPPLAWS